MYFFQEQDTGNWVLGNNTNRVLPAGVCELSMSSDKSIAKIKNSISGEVYAPNIPVTDFKKADGSRYATFNELYYAVWAFFQNLPTIITPNVLGGSVIGGDVIVTGHPSPELTLAGNVAGSSIVKWQKSVSPYTSWVDISNTIATYTSGNLTQDTLFRAVILIANTVIPSSYTLVTIGLPPTKPLEITGDTTVLAESTDNVYSIEEVDTATSYNWTVPTGWTITAGATTSEITVTAGLFGEDGNITVTAESIYGISPAQTLAVATLVTIGLPPAKPLEIIGDTTVLAESTDNVYSIAEVDTATSYNWTVPTGWTITAGATTSEITVTAGLFGEDGDITVTAESIYGISTAQTLAVATIQGT